MGYKVAVAGVTGAVGTEMLKVLEDRNFPVDSLRALASSRSVGKKIKFKGEEITVEELKKDSFNNIDIALFSAGASRSKEFCPAAVESGAVVIDNSSAFRMDPEIPLVVPEVNPEDIKKHKGIIANPNCSTIIMIVAIAPIYRAVGIKRIVVSTYQAASGAGAKAMQELLDQTKDLLDGKEVKPDKFAHQIGFNLFPHIDVFLENGYSKEEMKMVNETRKMLHNDDLKISATTVRVPVLRAHSESINITTEKKITVEEVRNLLKTAPGIIVYDDLTKNEYPMPILATGEYDTYVGRIREDISQENGIDMFVSGDQLLKGAALNAVQIAEEWIK